MTDPRLARVDGLLAQIAGHADDAHKSSRDWQTRAGLSLIVRLIAEARSALKTADRPPSTLARLQALVDHEADLTPEMLTAFRIFAAWKDAEGLDDADTIAFAPSKARTYCARPGCGRDLTNGTGRKLAEHVAVCSDNPDCVDFGRILEVRARQQAAREEIVS